MSGRIDGQGPLIQPQQVTPEAQVHVAQGEMQGQKVIHMQDANSMVQDAAEELTFGASETVEKKLSKRKVSSSGQRGMDALERAQMWIKKIPDMEDPKKLQQFLARLKQEGSQTPGQLRQTAKEAFKDVSQQYGALSFAKEQLKAEGGHEELVQALDEALKQSMEEHGPEIRAGINVSETAKRFSDEGLGKVGELRDFYRDTVLKYEGFTETFKSLQEQFPGPEFRKGLDFLIRAAGSDLQAQGPSIDPNQLKRVVDDLYRLEVLGNTHKSCENLVQRMDSSFQIKSKMSGLELMNRILELKDERWLRPDQFRKLCDDAGVKGTQAQIYFLRETVSLIKDLPTKVFENMEDRTKLIDAVQEAHDHLVDLEEQGE